MDYRFLKDAVRDFPDPKLLEALDRGAAQTDILSLLNVEVQRSTSRLQRLREVQNSFSSPMYRLISEILSQIFFIYAEDNEELYNMRWSRLLLMCKRWYEVAVHTPRLWSFIEIGQDSAGAQMNYGFASYDLPRFQRDVRRIEAQQARAGDWPWAVSVNLFGIHGPELKDREKYMPILCNRRFLISFSVSGTASSVLKALSALATHSHTNLQTVAVKRTDHDIDEVMRPEVRSLLDCILRDRVPNLRSLRTTDIPFDWALVKSLRILNVDHMQTSHFSFSLIDVTGALARSPLLEELDLRLPATFSPAPGVPSLNVGLARVASILLQASTDVCTQFVQALPPLPCSARIHVSTLFPADAGESEASPSLSLVSYLGKHASQNHAPVIRSVTVFFQPSFRTDILVQRMKFVGQRRPVRRPVRRESRSPTFSIAKPFNHEYIVSDAFIPRGSESGAITECLRTWPLSNAEFLDIRQNRDMEREWWDALFSELPAVSTVIVRPESPGARSLIDTLLTRLREGRRSSVANLIFDVDNLAEPPINMQWRPETRLHTCITLMRALSYCADAARAGCPLDTLEIINEPADPENRLFAPSSDVDWSELYENLKKGFVYEGTLYGPDTGREGMARDSFAVV